MTKPPRLYVASSWRNHRYPSVVLALRAAGFDCYDFRNPGPGDYGFSWSQIDPNWQSWTPAEYVAALSHPSAERGFTFDMDALKWCDACVLVQPCGRSAHLEVGWAAGAGKPTFILLAEGQEPELMVKMCTALCADVPELIDRLRTIFPRPNPGAKPCVACEIERMGCGCDGALDDGCFLCTPTDHARPVCPPTCPKAK